jgi:hypothetical protein
MKNSIGTKGAICVLYWLLIGAPAITLAQQSAPPHIEKVRIGLPGSQKEEETARSRNGAWAPVYVKLKASPAGNVRDRYKLRVETTDTENTAYHYDVAVPALAPNDDYNAIAYVRPGAAGSEFSVDLLTADGHSVQGVPRITREADRETLGAKDVLYLSVGGKMAEMKRSILGLPALAAGAADDAAEQKGIVQFAYIENDFDMPDLWFGYEAADVVILVTRDEKFINDLNSDNGAPRRKALAEWVRRGGKLIVSVGPSVEHASVVAQVLDKMPLADFDKMPLINCRIEGSAICPETTNLARWAAAGGAAPQALHNVEILRLIPGNGVTTLASDSAKVGDKTQECPVVVEASCGLGRVWMTAFDLDGPPFKTWPEGQKAFWAKVQSEFTPKAGLAARPPQGQPQQWAPGGDGFGGEPPALLAELQRTLENFEQVPVVNFGWVALFILIYILIIGPLDYVLLTRVFKRPELTWITFPVVVVSLSVLVYCVAYAMKGDDLRINKIDLVEYDLNTPQQAYGTTWFTLFSPRIQDYTIGVEPSAPGWATAPPEGATSHPVEVAVLANPDLAERVGSSSLFRKPYAYAEDACGLERVPIPVWSTRTFQASWRAGVDPAKPPLATSLRRDSMDKDKLVGEITNQLPVELQSVTIFYQGRYHIAPDLAPGASFDVRTLFAGGKIGVAGGQWVGNAQTLAPPTGAAFAPADLGQNGRFNNQQSNSPVKQPYQLLKDLMFHNKAENSQMNNSGLRPFDQSWRLDEEKTAPVQADKVWRDEVVLVARAPTLYDHFENVARDPGSATRLWLGRLPASKAERPGLSGFLGQQTYVRAYIPIQSPK